MEHQVWVNNSISLAQFCCVQNVSIAIISSNFFDTSAFLFIILTLEKPIHNMFSKAYIYVYFLQAWTHEEFPKVKDPSRANFVGAL